MNERQLRALKRRNARKQGDAISLVLVATLLLVLTFVIMNAVFSAIDHRVCRTASQNEYNQLHCGEVK